MSNRATRWAARERAWRLLYPDRKLSRVSRRLAHMALDAARALGVRGEERRIASIVRELGDQKREESDV